MDRSDHKKAIYHSKILGSTLYEPNSFIQIQNPHIVDYRENFDKIIPMIYFTGLLSHYSNSGTRHDSNLTVKCKSETKQ